jgi:hypothetical protein
METIPNEILYTILDYISITRCIFFNQTNKEYYKLLPKYIKKKLIAKLHTKIPLLGIKSDVSIRTKSIKELYIFNQLQTQNTITGDKNHTFIFHDNKLDIYYTSPFKAYKSIPNIQTYIPNHQNISKIISSTLYGDIFFITTKRELFVFQYDTFECKPTTVRKIIKNLSDPFVLYQLAVNALDIEIHISNSNTYQKPIPKHVKNKFPWCEYRQYIAFYPMIMSHFFYPDTNNHLEYVFYKEHLPRKVTTFKRELLALCFDGKFYHFGLYGGTRELTIYNPKTKKVPFFVDVAKNEYLFLALCNEGNLYYMESCDHKDYDIICTKFEDISNVTNLYYTSKIVFFLTLDGWLYSCSVFQSILTWKKERCLF